MTHLADVYRPSLALSTDLYQLTMAQAYRHAGRAEEEAVFHLFFRRNPFGGGFAVACGLARALDYLAGFHFTAEDVAYLGGLLGNDGRPLFDPAFLRELGELRLRCDVDAVPEGTVVFPYEPLVRVRGPILHAQLVETALLNFVNFETLIATKAARVCLAARGDEVIDFGLRRAQGPDGGLSASRAAYVGGVVATSNVLAGRLFGLPVRGTHAHSWVMAFASELEAFEAWARAQPNNCVFLVDTYDTLDGVRRAAGVALRLRERGHEPIGIRLDSGDLAYLSIEARKILDDAGLRSAKIVASNDLDEHLIASLKEQGARIDTWGVGTRLVTGGDQAALGGVYKLGAVREPGRRVAAPRQGLGAGGQDVEPRRAAGAAVLGSRRVRGRRDLRRGDRPARLAGRRGPARPDAPQAHSRAHAGRGPAGPGGARGPGGLRAPPARGDAVARPGPDRPPPPRHPALRQPAPVPGRPRPRAARAEDPPGPRSQRSV